MSNRGLRLLAVTLALINGALWFCAPLIREAVIDTHAGEFPPRYRPISVPGVQELLVYFDPWLARTVFPVVYTLGLAAIPFLLRRNVNPTRTDLAISAMVAILLVWLEAVWLVLTGIGLFLRGPNWNLYWPDEPWVLVLAPLNNVNLSEIFWLRLDDPFHVFDMDTSVLGIMLRELPGFLFLAAYFAAGFIVPRTLFLAANKTTPYWRWVVLMILIQTAGLVPLKIFLRWAFNLKYVISLPEYFLNL